MVLVLGPLFVGAVAVERVVECVAPLPGRAGHIVGGAGHRDLDQRGFERGELVVGVRGVAGFDDRLDVFRGDRSRRPDRGGVVQLFDRPRHPHPVIGLTAGAARVCFTNHAARGAGPVERPFTRPVELS